MGYGRKVAAFPQGEAATVSPPPTPVNPRSDSFEVPKIYQLPGSKTVLRCLRNLQTKRYGRVVDIPAVGLMQHINKLYDTYTHEEIIRAMYLCAEFCDHPFSLAQVEKSLERTNGRHSQPASSTPTTRDLHLFD